MAALVLGLGMARAAETIESLRPGVEAYCRANIGKDAGPKGADAACKCMVDGIVTDFGEDALAMMKIITARLDPSQVKEIARLLGIPEKQARAFVEMAAPKMEAIQTRCTAPDGGGPTPSP